MDSDLVTSDVRGNKIGVVVRNGRPENGMPAFKLSPQEIYRAGRFPSCPEEKSDRSPADAAGWRSAIFKPAMSRRANNISMVREPARPAILPTGDLAGVARRYRGLELEKRMLYPNDAPATVTVTLPSGQTVSGKLSYQDEFTIGLTDDAGWYQSWPTSQVKYTINAPAEAHVELLGKYTDDDVHNLMAYLQTLR